MFFHNYSVELSTAGVSCSISTTIVCYRDKFITSD